MENKNELCYYVINGERAGRRKEDVFSGPTKDLKSPRGKMETY